MDKIAYLIYIRCPIIRKKKNYTSKCTKCCKGNEVSWKHMEEECRWMKMWYLMWSKGAQT